MSSAIALLFTLIAAISPASDVPIGWSRPVASVGHLGHVIDAGACFESASLGWRGDPSIPLRVRASLDGIHWSGWSSAPPDDDSSDASSMLVRTAIVHFGTSMRFIELDRDVDEAQATFFPLHEAAQRDAIAQRPARILTAGETVPVRSRLEWGCPDGEGSRWTPAFSKVTHVVVHHTAGANSVSDWDAELRSIWYLHTFTNGWGDIGYNYLIAPTGVVYEGRAGGEGAIGAHFSCRNTNTVGIALLGTYSTVSPTREALASLEALLRELCRLNGIDPLAVALHAPSGLVVPTIIGHRDGNSSSLTCTRTECPGDVLYAMLPALRVEAICALPAITSQPRPAAVLPGASITLAAVATGTGPLEYQWFEGPAGDHGSPVADGTAATLTVTPKATTTYRLRVHSDCGEAWSEEATITVTNGQRTHAVRR